MVVVLKVCIFQSEVKVDKLQLHGLKWTDDAIICNFSFFCILPPHTHPYPADFWRCDCRTLMFLWISAFLTNNLHSLFVTKVELMKSEKGREHLETWVYSQLSCIVRLAWPKTIKLAPPCHFTLLIHKWGTDTSSDKARISIGKSSFTEIEKLFCIRKYY